MYVAHTGSDKTAGYVLKGSKVISIFMKQCMAFKLPRGQLNQFEAVVSKAAIWPSMHLIHASLSSSQ